MDGQTILPAGVPATTRSIRRIRGAHLDGDRNRMFDLASCLFGNQRQAIDSDQDSPSAWQIHSTNHFCQCLNQVIARHVAPHFCFNPDRTIRLIVGFSRVVRLRRIDFGLCGWSSHPPPVNLLARTFYLECDGYNKQGPRLPEDDCIMDAGRWGHGKPSICAWGMTPMILSRIDHSITTDMGNCCCQSCIANCVATKV